VVVMNRLRVDQREQDVRDIGENGDAKHRHHQPKRTRAEPSQPGGHTSAAPPSLPHNAPPGPELRNSDRGLRRRCLGRQEKTEPTLIGRPSFASFPQNDVRRLRCYQNHPAHVRLASTNTRRQAMLVVMCAGLDCEAAQLVERRRRACVRADLHPFAVLTAHVRDHGRMHDRAHVGRQRYQRQGPTDGDPLLHLLRVPLARDRCTHGSPHQSGDG